MKHLGKTRPFLGPDGKIFPNSIAQNLYLKLGGIEQWVMIRGENVANPVLVVLNGGPGYPEMRLFRHSSSVLENYFTVVYWEQRGTGKSFDRHLSKSSMSVERFITDLDELVDIVRAHLSQDRVTIYGHSWGSALGALYAARHPDKVAAFIGGSQAGDALANERLSYDHVLAEAQRRHHRGALQALRRIGPPPHTGRKGLTQRLWLSRFDAGGGRKINPAKLIRILLGGPESSILDLPNIIRGMIFSMDAMWAEVSALNLIRLAPELKMPAFFLIGRHDNVIAPEISLEYIQALKAPSKKIIWFEDSGHMFSIQEPKKFNQVMLEQVLPLVMRERRGQNAA